MHEMNHLLFDNEKPASIFEVGCGSSAFLKDYQENFSHVIVGGLDIDAGSYQSSRSALPSFADNFIQHNALNVPWPVKEKSWDIVFTVGTLLLIPDPFPVIKEMLRIAKQKIILAEYHDETKDAYGDQGKIPQPASLYDLRIRRDYQKVFKQLGMQAEFLPCIAGKTIIKCNV